MASDSQAYYLKPHDFGGGQGSFKGVSPDGPRIRDPTKLGKYVRQAEGGGAQAFTLDESDGVVTIEAVSDRYDQVVRVTVSGPSVEDIALTVSRP